MLQAEEQDHSLRRIRVSWDAIPGSPVTVPAYTTRDTLYYEIQVHPEDWDQVLREHEWAEDCVIEQFFGLEVT